MNQAPGQGKWLSERAKQRLDKTASNYGYFFLLYPLRLGTPIRHQWIWSQQSTFFMGGGSGDSLSDLADLDLTLASDSSPAPSDSRTPLAHLSY